MAGLNARSHSASKSISAKPCPTGASVFFFPNGITMKQMRRGVRLTSLLLALAIDTATGPTARWHPMPETCARDERGHRVPSLPSLRHQLDRPEIVAEIRVGEVRVGDGEVAVHAPPRAPGVAHDEALLRVVIADREDGMSAQELFAVGRHGDHAGLRDLGRFEG